MVAKQNPRAVRSPGLNAEDTRLIKDVERGSSSAQAVQAYALTETGVQRIAMGPVDSALIYGAEESRRGEQERISVRDRLPKEEGTLKLKHRQGHGKHSVIATRDRPCVRRCLAQIRRF